MTDFDFIVLGGGSGGLASAQRASEYGARVALLEPGRLGGTCVNVGCVPKKVMWNAAELAGRLGEASAYGFDLAVKGHDFAALRCARDAYVERLNGIYAANLEKKGIVHIASPGRFAGPHEIADDSGGRYRAPHILISTGGRPSRPAVEGAELGIDSDGFFALDAAPAHVAIVGAGYIAVELAGILAALGSRVSLFVRRERLLRGFDEMLAVCLAEHMADAGVEIITSAAPHALAGGDGLTLETEAGRHTGFDVLIWATGREPNADRLGLESTAVERGPSGHIVVDEYENTAESGVYAVGDVTGEPELTPVAIAAGRRLADRLFGGQPERKLSYELVPTVIFSHPPIGTVGLAEDAARERYGNDVRVYTSRFVGMFNAITEARPKTSMKLVVTGREERIVGCHVIGAGADEMLQGFAVAISMGATKRDFDDTIAIHPTSAEELVTMR